VVVIGAIIGFYYWRIAIIIAPLVVVPLSSAAAYVLATDSYSWGTRVDAWLIVVEIAKANPIFGLGFGNYRWFAPLFPIRGWAVQFNSHSQYIDIYAQAGIIGLICFLWFFGALVVLGWRLRNRVPAGFPRAYVYGALGGWVGTIVAGSLGDWVIPFFYNIGYRGFRASVLGWLFLGGLVALERLYLSPQKQIAPENVDFGQSG
jgi:O-antigen ligase